MAVLHLMPRTRPTAGNTHDDAVDDSPLADIDGEETVKLQDGLLSVARGRLFNRRAFQGLRRGSTRNRGPLEGLPDGNRLTSRIAAKGLVVPRLTAGFALRFFHVWVFLDSIMAWSSDEPDLKADWPDGRTWPQITLLAVLPSLVQLLSHGVSYPQTSLGATFLLRFEHTSRLWLEPDHYHLVNSRVHVIIQYRAYKHCGANEALFSYARRGKSVEGS